MLQVIFGDDEHTAADGPYNRVLKTRKWLYIGSAAIFVFTLGLYDETAAGETLKFISLPERVVGYAVAAGLVYLSLQYILLTIQLLSAYDIILAERFTFRRADELTKARERVKYARKNYSDSIVRSNEHRDNAFAEHIAQLQKVLDAATSDLVSIERQKELAPRLEPIPGLVDELERRRINAQAQRDGAAQRLSEIREDAEAARASLTVPSEADLQLSKDELESAVADLETLQKQVPSNRRFYRSVEVIIDILRVVPPFALALAALAAVVRW